MKNINEHLRKLDNHLQGKGLELLDTHLLFRLFSKYTGDSTGFINVVVEPDVVSLKQYIIDGHTDWSKCITRYVDENVTYMNGSTFTEIRNSYVRLARIISVDDYTLHMKNVNDLLTDMVIDLTSEEDKINGLVVNPTTDVSIYLNEAVHARQLSR